MISILRDPALSGIGSIATVLALFAYLYVEREKLLPINARRYVFWFIVASLFGVILGIGSGMLNFLFTAIDNITTSIFGSSNSFLLIVQYLIAAGFMFYGIYRLISPLVSYLVWGRNQRLTLKWKWILITLYSKQFGGAESGRCPDRR